MCTAHVKLDTVLCTLSTRHCVVEAVLFKLSTVNCCRIYTESDCIPFYRKTIYYTLKFLNCILKTVHCKNTKNTICLFAGSEGKGRSDFDKWILGLKRTIACCTLVLYAYCSLSKGYTKVNTGDSRCDLVIITLFTRERSRKDQVNTAKVFLSLTNTMLYCTLL